MSIQFIAGLAGSALLLISLLMILMKNHPSQTLKAVRRLAFNFSVVLITVAVADPVQMKDWTLEKNLGNTIIIFLITAFVVAFGGFDPADFPDMWKKRRQSSSKNHYNWE